MRSLLLLLFLVAPLAAQAAASEESKKILADAYVLYEKGAYAQAVSKAKTVPLSDKSTKAALSFFLATVEMKLQNFKEASRYFAQAINAGNTSPSLHYDYGQALFAQQKLDEARVQFKKSIVKKYKIAASAYYIGFISQLKEEIPQALDYYNRIQKLASDPDKVKQPALYQIAEISYGDMEKYEGDDLKRKHLEDKTYPLYEKARDYAKNTATADQARAKLDELDTKLSQMVPRMRNGVPLPVKPYTLRLTQDIEYNTNVISEADQALISVSYRDAFLSRTNLLGKYQFNAKSTWSFIPELSLTSVFHSRRSVGAVFQNDNLVIAPALRTKYEHSVAGKPATALFDLEYNLMLRDYEAQHKFPFYSRYWNLTLGERAKWFNTGTSTIKVGIKLYESQNPARNSYSPSVSFTQNFRVWGNYDWSNTFTADYLHARDDFNDEKNYKLRSSIVFPKAFEKVDMTTALTSSLKDTGKQKGARGNELLFNPSVNLARDLWKKVGGEFEYSFTKNWSKAKSTYQYTQHVFKTSVNCSF